jgi:hypothetical protein
VGGGAAFTFFLGDAAPCTEDGSESISAVITAGGWAAEEEDDIGVVGGHVDSRAERSGVLMWSPLPAAATKRSSRSTS